MATERITEEIVRSHFKKEAGLKLEEQESKNIIIQKLLQQASKRGTSNLGRPEFILQHNKRPEIIGVVECKSDTKFHRSKNDDNPEQFAVDGARWYAEHLRKEFDVLAFGVSGQDTKNLRVTAFFCLKGEQGSTELNAPIDELLTFREYIDIARKNETTRQRDYSRTLASFKSLNRDMESLKMKTGNRSLFVSGTLLALEDNNFYKFYSEMEEISDHLFTTIERIINHRKSDSLNEESRRAIMQAFQFIRNEAHSRAAIVDLINTIKKDIHTTLESGAGFDPISQGYVEFLRYSNNDKSLGIVLTPQHITELCAELAGVADNSIVLDNCCGTGGFLVAAMSKMLKSAKTEDKRKEIKKRRLRGIETRPEIFALAASNMILHKDGKSGIKLGSCFDKKTSWTEKANAGMLNPPFRNVKKNKRSKENKYEWEFVLNNLEALAVNSRCVALLPMRCVLGDKNKKNKKNHEYKERILRNHTLEAVISLPNQLFHESKTGVVTCLVVLTAHHPHPADKETWFLYGKDDGHTVRHHKGRPETEKGSWNKTKNKWLQMFQKREAAAGLSVTRKVTADDEWCAEAYLETDYAALTREDFERTLREYVSYKVVMP